jgi:hypothetical protein
VESIDILSYGEEDIYSKVTDSYFYCYFQ